MHPAGIRLPATSSLALGSILALIVATVPTTPVVAGAGVQDDYKIAVTASPPPDSLDPAVREHVRDEAITLLTAADEPVMDLWFARSLPAPTAPPGHPGVAYGSLEEGVVLAVMRLHREHYDYRDQGVGAGLYLARYLRQPDDGNHLGETTWRDFAVLTSSVSSSVGGQDFQQTLDQALELNLHPFAWGLWPPAEVTTSEEPGLAAFQPDKWAIKLTLPRDDGSELPIALVVVGNEWHY